MADYKVQLVDIKTKWTRYVRNKFLSMLRGKLSIDEWLDLYDFAEIENTSLFPYEDSELYVEYANVLLEDADFKREGKIILPKCFLQFCSYENVEKSKMMHNERENLFTYIIGDKAIWKKIILDTYEERQKIPNSIVYENLIGELRDAKIKKTLCWFLIWSLRLTFVTSHQGWNNNHNWSIAYFSETARMIYYTQAYKDRELMETILNFGLGYIRKQTCTLPILMNTYFMPNVVCRLLPIPKKCHPTKDELMRLVVRGLFPAEVSLHDIDYRDNFAMSGPQNWIHDFVHFISYITVNSMSLVKMNIQK
jgi:hypothetical protein